MTRSDARAASEPREPLAVVGMACRFPGGADSPAAYWQLLRSGQEGVVEVPPERWDVNAFYDPDPKAVGKIYARRFGMLQEPLDRFDASFFGISPKEAWPLDPAQRLLLEVAWECLEHAGIPPHSLQGTDTGVFVGVSGNDYIYEQLRLGSIKDLSAYHGTGVAGSFGSGRISHFLGVGGPSVSIDTACSSSMVAAMLAADSLWSGRCRMALAGGTMVLLSPTSTMVLCRLGALSPSGECRAFDAGADGFVRGEGAGLIALKRLSHALEDGDRVLALMRGGAWNHDGRSSSLTVPRREAQESVMRSALDSADLHPHQIGYLEAHGTGTPIGDPIEATAIGNVFAVGRAKDDPLMVASGKTNIGHLEIASGVAAIMKVVLSLQHREIPAHLHLDQLNPHVDWDRYPIRIPTETEPWHAPDGPRIAGINSFGLSGTNAHIILEEAPRAAAHQGPPNRPVHLLTVSGRTEGAARDLATRYQTALAGREVALEDFSHTTTVGRTHHRRRFAVVGETREEIIEALELQRTGPVATAPKPSQERPSIAFLCTGQGAQYPGMGRALFESSPTFRAVLERCDSILREHLEHPLLEVLYSDEADSDLLNRTEYTQPAMFAIEMALAALWKSWGIEPSHVMGHSLGEYVAATIAGVFDLEDALSLVARRGRLMRDLAETGAMAVVFAPEERVLEAIHPYAATVSLGAVNGPQNTVISGVDAHIDSILESFEAEGIQHRRLQVSHAFHSPLMESMLDPFEDAVRGLDLRPPSISLVSNVTGELADPAVVVEPAYWRRHVRSPVRFADSVRALRAADVRCYLEVGPHPTLLGMAGLTLGDERLAWIPSLRRGQDDWRQIIGAVGALYEAGFEPDWDELDRGQGGRRATIPTYAFQPKRHWYPVVQETGGQRLGSLPVRSADAIVHPLLGTRLRSPAISGVVYQALLEANQPRYLGGYRVGRMAFAPLSVLLEMVRAAVEHGLRWRSFGLADIDVDDPLGLPRGDGRVCQVVVSDPDGEVSSFKVLSAARSGSGTPRWATHVTGTVRRTSPDASGPSAGVGGESAAPATIRERCQQTVDVGGFYDALATDGLALGAVFRPLREIWAGEGEVLARLELSDAVRHETSRYGVHPALLDGIFQAPAALLAHGRDDAPEVLIPTRLEWFRATSDAGTVRWVHARLRTRGTSTLEVDVHGYDEDGREVVEARGLVQARTPRASFGRVISEDEWSYGIDWRETEKVVGSLDTSGGWLVLEDESGIGCGVARALEERGATVVRCVPGPREGATHEGAFVADLSDASWADSLFDEVASRGCAPLEGIVSCWGVDRGLPHADGQEMLKRVASLCAGTTDVVRVVNHRGALAGTLHLVTRGSVDVGSERGGDSQIESSALWGLLPVLRNEHPEVHGRIVDLDPNRGLEAVDDLLAELASVDAEDRVAHRLGRRWGPRLGHFRESGPTRDRLFRSDRVYFVSGGFGGIGRAVAHWLAEHDVGAIALNARRAPDEAAQAWIEQLRDKGARIEVLLGDVSRREDVDRIFDRLLEWGMDLGGVFHGAGVLDDGLLADMSLERYRQVMAPKVAGAWNLHLRTEDLRPDHFVLFSSIASFMGPPSQGNYAAANAFMGALAEHRMRLGLPALCVDWGPWAGEGMAGRLGERERQAMESRGMEFLEGSRALGVLEDHLREQTARVAIMAVDWPRLSEALMGMEVPPFLSDLVDESAPDAAAGASTAQARLQELNELADDMRVARLVEMVTAHMAEVLGVQPDQLPADTDVRESGFDSLMALEVRYRVESELGVTIPVAGLMKDLSPARLAEILVDLIASVEVEDPAEQEGEWIEGEV